MTEMPANETKATSVPSIERASGRPWQEWLKLFEGAGGTSLSHQQLAKIALEAMPESLKNPHWWAQGTAIAYEQHAGMRVPGQSSTGDFRVSASRTVPFDRDEAVERWVATFAEADHRDHAATNQRQSRTEKRSFWRATLGEAGKIEVAAESKPDGRALVAISHTGLDSGEEIETWRAHWKSCLAKL